MALVDPKVLALYKVFRSKKQSNVVNIQIIVRKQFDILLIHKWQNFSEEVCRRSGT